MLRSLCLATAVLAFAAIPASAQERAPAEATGNMGGLIAQYSAAYNVPESLIRRVIRRESGGNARVVYRGNYGLMQIKLGTARALGYRGGAAGLLDPDTNMKYAVKYLAGAWQLARGSHDRAVHYYAAGYYQAAKRNGALAPTATRAVAPAATLENVKSWGSGALAAAGPLASPASQNFH